MEVEKIIQDVRNGDVQQFNNIIKMYQQQLFHYVYCIINNTQDAEDILQDTFVIAYQKLDKYKVNTSFSAWLYRIARNLSLNLLKKKRKVVPIDKSEIDSMIELSESINIQETENEKINKVFMKLTLDEKNIIILRAYQEMSYKEIAYILNKNESAIRKQYERARKKFIEYYDEIKEEGVIYGV